MKFPYEDPRREQRIAKLRDAGYTVTDLGSNSEKEVKTIEIEWDGVKGYGIRVDYDTWRFVTDDKAVVPNKF